MQKPASGSRGYIRAIVAAQMLAQLGAFALPALLPGYIERWSLSKTEAGWLVEVLGKKLPEHHARWSPYRHVAKNG